MKNVKVVDLKLHNNKSVTLFIQVLLIVLILIFGILTLFVKEFITVLYVLLALIMFVMAINNAMFFHKKYLTIIYIILGVFISISTILELL